MRSAWSRSLLLGGLLFGVFVALSTLLNSLPFGAQSAEAWGVALFCGVLCAVGFVVALSRTTRRAATTWMAGALVVAFAASLRVVPFEAGQLFRTNNWPTVLGHLKDIVALGMFGCVLVLPTMVEPEEPQVLPRNAHGAIMLVGGSVLLVLEYFNWRGLVSSPDASRYQFIGMPRDFLGLGLLFWHWVVNHRSASRLDAPADAARAQARVRAESDSSPGAGDPATPVGAPPVLTVPAPVWGNGAAAPPVPAGQATASSSAPDARLWVYENGKQSDFPADQDNLALQYRSANAFKAFYCFKQPGVFLTDGVETEPEAQLVPFVLLLVARMGTVVPYAELARAIRLGTETPEDPRGVCQAMRGNLKQRGQALGAALVESIKPADGDAGQRGYILSTLAKCRLVLNMPVEQYVSAPHSPLRKLDFRKLRRLGPR